MTTQVQVHVPASSNVPVVTGELPAGTTIPDTIKFDELKTVAKLDVPVEHRLCRIINKGAGNISLGALVPVIGTESIDYLIGNASVRLAIISMLEGIQDKLARQYVMEGGNKEMLICDFADINKIIMFLEAENESKIRLSKEAIESWFMADIAPLLVAALKAKGITQQKQLEDTCNAFKNSFAVLAGKQVSMSEQIKGQLEKAMLLLPEGYENHVAELVASKLLAVTEAKVELNAL